MNNYFERFISLYLLGMVYYGEESLHTSLLTHFSSSQDEQHIMIHTILARLYQDRKCTPLQMIQHLKTMQDVTFYLDQIQIIIQTWLQETRLMTEE
jgi:hypothetical protein